MRHNDRAASAPWIRTRLRTAPGAATALAVLVLVTAFLAAAFPRAVDAYETKGLRHDILTADAGRSTLEVARPQPGLELPQAQRDAEARSPELARIGSGLLKALPAPLRADTSSVAYGVRTSKAGRRERALAGEARSRSAAAHVCGADRAEGARHPGLGRLADDAAGGDVGLP